MPHSKEEVIKMINLDEPDYGAIVQLLSDDDIPVLADLAAHENPAIAAKAISCLGLMHSAKALPAIGLAVQHANPVIRLAAAHALRNMTALRGSIPLLDKLLDDHDVGVRKFALKSVAHANVISLKDKVRALHENETNPAIKELSHDIFKNLK